MDDVTFGCVALRGQPEWLLAISCVHDRGGVWCLSMYCYVCVQWMQLRSRKQNLVRLFEQMQQYQFETQMAADADQPLESHVRTLTDDDVDRFSSVCCVLSRAVELTR